MKSLTLIVVMAGCCAQASLIVGMNAKDGLVVCADNRRRISDRDYNDTHKLRISANNVLFGVVGTGEVLLADNTTIFSFYDEFIDYLKMYAAPEEVDWSGTGKFLEYGFTRKVIKRIGGMPQWLQPSSKEPMKSLAEVSSFYESRSGTYYFASAYLFCGESRGVAFCSGFGTPATPIKQSYSSLLIAGRADIFSEMNKAGTRASELAQKQVVLRQLLRNVQLTKEAHLSTVVDVDSAKEALRYLIYLTSVLGPDLTVSETSDCYVAQPSGKFIVTKDLPPLSPEEIRFK